MCRRFVAVLSVLFLSSAATGQRADHEPMLLRASNVSKAAIEPLVPLCARAAGIEVEAEYANNPAVAKDIIDGARFDMVVVETHMLDDLATRNLVARSSIRPLAALRMGLATREPGPYPRIDTEAAFKRALMNARSIGYIGDGHSGEVFLEIVDRLKLREPLAGKLVPFTGAYAGAAEASERLHYVVAPFFKPLPAPLRLVGYFPASLHADVDVSAGASPKAVPAAAKFIACLRSPAARALFKEKGYRLDP
jgi:molybdate transport system substrate-binding protein